METIEILENNKCSFDCRVFQTNWYIYLICNTQFLLLGMCISQFPYFLLLSIPWFYQFPLNKNYIWYLSIIIDIFDSKIIDPLQRSITNLIHNCPHSQSYWMAKIWTTISLPPTTLFFQLPTLSLMGSPFKTFWIAKGWNIRKKKD